MSLDDVPKKVQYVVVDSNFVNGTNNTFSLDLTLKSNTHVEDMSRVLGIKLVDFYITQIGDSGASGSTNIAKFVDIVCPDIPKVAQILDERQGQILARVPLERHFSGSNNVILRDKQWRRFNQQTNYFNPISIKKLNFTINDFLLSKSRYCNTRTAYFLEFSMLNVIHCKVEQGIIMIYISCI